jgi:hypothetical protein
MGEILTAGEVAAMLKISKRQGLRTCKGNGKPHPKHQDSHVL